MRVQTQISKSIPHIEALVSAVVGDSWLDVVNAERARDGRRPYRTGSGDERAALALFAHAPGVRDRWPSAAKIASQLGGILNAAHHNDAERWSKGDDMRVAQLADTFAQFLADHPADSLTVSWHVKLEAGTLEPRKRKPTTRRTSSAAGQPGQPLSDVLRQISAQMRERDESPVADALAAVAASAAAEPRCAGHVQVQFRDTGRDPVQSMTLTARRSDAPAKAFVVSVSV